MKRLTENIMRVVGDQAGRLQTVDEHRLQHSLTPEKWCTKEVVGHLIDSAQNNIQRLVRAQYEACPHIVYDQDEWVRIQAYRSYPTADLLLLWSMLNNHLCHILLQMDEADLSKHADWGKTAPDPQPLRVIATDYLRHLRHHVGQMENILSNN